MIFVFLLQELFERQDAYIRHERRKLKNIEKECEKNPVLKNCVEKEQLRQLNSATDDISIINAYLKCTSRSS